MATCLVNVVCTRDEILCGVLLHLLLDCWIKADLATSLASTYVGNVGQIR